MASSTSRKRIEELVSKYEPLMAEAFLAAIDRIKSTTRINQLISALEQGSIERALQIVGIAPADFARVADVAVAAYTETGHATADMLTGRELSARFDTRATEAEQQIRTLATKITGELSAETVAAIRQTLEAGLAAGRGPRQTALDIIGRIGPTGRREGGLIGLTRLQEKYVRDARANLLSGDPDLMNKYLALKRRDKRLDATVNKAIREGKTLSVAFIDKAIGKLSDSYLLLRGETIARTETLAALNQASNQAMEQAIAEHKIPRENVIKMWRATLDPRTRDSHAELNRVSINMDQRFANGLLYPHDPDGIPSEVINCRCVAEYRIDHLAALEAAEKATTAPTGPRAPTAKELAKLDADAKRYVLEQGKRTNNEFLSLYNANDGVAMAPTTSGLPGRVNFTQEIVDALDNHTNNIIAHHNHPQSTSFSGADIDQVIIRPGLKGLWAHGHNGSSYYAEKGASVGRGTAPGYTIPVAQMPGLFREQVRIFLQNKIFDEVITIDEANRIQAHIISLALEKTGVITYRANLTQNNKEIWQRIEKMVQDEYLKGVKSG